VSASEGLGRALMLGTEQWVRPSDQRCADCGLFFPWHALVEHRCQACLDERYARDRRARAEEVTEPSHVVLSIRRGLHEEAERRRAKEMRDEGWEDRWREEKWRDG
jgi:hypothetical protein